MTPAQSRDLAGLMGCVIGASLALASTFIGFTEDGKVNALFSRCHWRGGQEITRGVWGAGTDTTFECFVNGRVVDSYRLVRGPTSPPPSRSKP